MLVEVTELINSSENADGYDPEEQGFVVGKSAILNLNVVFKSVEVPVKLRKSGGNVTRLAAKVTSVTGQEMYILEDLSQF